MDVFVMFSVSKRIEAVLWILVLIFVFYGASIH